MKEITFISPQLGQTLSTDISESEILWNAFLTYNSIGKLVRFESENQVPYLAQSWKRDGKKWHFFLRKDLRCEDGEEISPENFKISLTNSMRRLSQNNPLLPVFQHLKGFEKFLKGEALDGIVADNDKLILTFEFEKEMVSGVLEYLAMSPFGYLCSANFNEDGSWKDPLKIVSSGSYKLTFLPEQKSFLIEKRSGWPLNREEMIDKILLTSNKELVKNWNKVIYFGSHPPSSSGDSLDILPGAPMSLGIISLSPSSTSFFETKKARLIFQKRIREVQEANKFIDLEHESTTDFYFSQPYSERAYLYAEELEENDLKPEKPLKFRISLESRTPSKEHVYNLVKATLDSLDWPYEIIVNPPSTYTDLIDPKYDGRYTISEVGMGVEAWVNDMLFCSEIGGEYPDPGKKICSLTESYNEGRLSYEEFSYKFAETIAKESAVIPILKRRYIWHLGKEIDRNTFSPLTNIPAFDLLRLKQ